MRYALSLAATCFLGAAVSAHADVSAVSATVSTMALSTESGNFL